ncbi:hypothetical protein AB5N19_04738 [Seiridium cardinale]
MTMKIVVSSLLLLAPITVVTAEYRLNTTACGSPSPMTPGTFNTSTIGIANLTREYGVWVPNTYDYNITSKLIFSYHGAGGNIAKQRALDGLTEPAFNEDHIVVYLQGAINADNATTWQGAPGAPADDITFTSALLDLMESQFCIDTKRIYATGKSQGAGFVGRLACDPQLSTRFAAFAPVSGAYYNADITEKANCNPDSMPIPCSPGRKNIPLLAFHGGADPTISYHGAFRKGACLPDIQYWVKEWAKREGVNTTASTVPITNSVDGMDYTYGNDLVKHVYDGDNVPHDWPATFPNSDNGGQNLTSFNATTWIMGFFNKHKLE